MVQAGLSYEYHSVNNMAWIACYGYCYYANYHCEGTATARHALPPPMAMAMAMIVIGQERKNTCEDGASNPAG
jgi:hypothetical protein